MFVCPIFPNYKIDLSQTFTDDKITCVGERKIFLSLFLSLCPCLHRRQKF